MKEIRLKERNIDARRGASEPVTGGASRDSAGRRSRLCSAQFGAARCGGSRGDRGSWWRRREPSPRRVASVAG